MLRVNRKLFIERRVEGIEVFGIKLISCDSQALTEALEVDDLPLPQELDWLDNIRIVYHAQNVVIGDPRLLLRRQILVQVGNGVALSLWQSLFLFSLMTAFLPQTTGNRSPPSGKRPLCDQQSRCQSRCA